MDAIAGAYPNHQSLERPRLTLAGSLDELDPHMRAVYDLAESCRYEVAHTHHVMWLALRLFDELHPLHQLDHIHRRWLRFAAMLHDIGWIEGGKAHHKTSLRLILTSPLLPWPRRKRLIVGSIARYHRRALPKVRHEHFAELSPADRKSVRTLAAILRVADALDHAHRSNVRDLSCDIDDARIAINCRGPRLSTGEIRKTSEKGDLMREVFGRNVQVAWAGT